MYHPRRTKKTSFIDISLLDTFDLLGDLERLRRFWLTGTCNPKKEEKKASEPLAPEQFLSAFFLLLCGILLAIGLMGLEHAYIKWVRRGSVKTDKAAGCCSLVSLVSTKVVQSTLIFEIFQYCLKLILCF